MAPSDLIRAAIEGMPPKTYGPERCAMFVAALAGRCSGSTDPCLKALAPVLRRMYLEDHNDALTAAKEPA